MPGYKVVLVYVINDILDVNECEIVYKHLNQRERLQCYNFVSTVFDFISPLSELCDLLSFYKGEIQILICFRNPFPLRAHFFFNLIFSAHSIVIYLENCTPEQAVAFATFMRDSGYDGEFKIMTLLDFID